MPEHKTYDGREIKTTKKIFKNGKAYVRITFKGQFGVRGPQVDVSLEEYEKKVVRSFQPRVTH